MKNVQLGGLAWTSEMGDGPRKSSGLLLSCVNSGGEGGRRKKLTKALYGSPLARIVFDGRRSVDKRGGELH